MTEPEVQSDASGAVKTAPEATSEATASRGLPWAALLLAVALLGALVALGITMKSLSNANAKTDTANSARDAAINYATQMTTYSYKSVDKDFAWITSGGTEAWARQYSQTADDIKKLVTDLKSTAVGKVTYAAASGHDRTHVTVLMFIDQTLTANGSTEPKTARSNIAMQMVKQGGKWLVDDVQLH